MVVAWWLEESRGDGCGLWTWGLVCGLGEWGLVLRVVVLAARGFGVVFGDRVWGMSKGSEDRVFWLCEKMRRETEISGTGD